MISPPKFQPFCFTLDLLLHKHSIRKCFLGQTYFGFQPPKVFTNIYICYNCNMGRKDLPDICVRQCAQSSKAVARGLRVYTSGES